MAVFEFRIPIFTQTPAGWMSCGWAKVCALECSTTEDTEEHRVVFILFSRTRGFVANSGRVF